MIWTISRQQNCDKEACPAGPEDRPDRGAAGPFQTIQEAIDSVPSGRSGPVTIRVPAGFFHERISITKPDIILEGAGADKTVISGNLGAFEILEDGLKRGTFRTQTVFVHADNVTIRNLTIENTAGPGRIAGQAIALYADGDRLTFKNLRLLGNQDTLFTGPLPEKEMEKGGFRGPLEFAPRIPGRHHYVNCYIEGNIDFIFGGAMAFFDNCEIFCRDPEPGSRENRTVSYITAASTPEGQKYGYVFRYCRLTSDAPPGSCYLGRPWREHARTVFLCCEMGAHISPEGWHDWGKKSARDTVCYAEYNSSGPGAPENRRVPWSRILTEEEASVFLAYVPF